MSYDSNINETQLSGPNHCINVQFSRICLDFCVSFFVIVCIVITYNSCLLKNIALDCLMSYLISKYTTFHAHLKCSQYICFSCVFYRFDSCRVIAREGHRSEFYYFILSGVGKYLP